MNEPLFRFETAETPTRCVKIRFEKTFAARRAAGAAADPLLAFENFVNKHLAKGYLHFQLDLRHVPYPSTRFIALLIALTVRARRRRGEITLDHVTETARNNFVTFSALSYLTLAPEATPGYDPATETIQPATRVPTARQSRPAPAVIKNVPAQKSPPPAANVQQPVFRPQLVDLPPAPMAVNKNEMPAAFSMPALHPAGKNLPAEKAIPAGESPALADIAEPPLVKAIARKIEAASGAGKKIQLRVESRASNLYQLCDFVTEHAALAGINDKEIGKIKIAVYEACLNVIEHAYHSRPDEWIDLEVFYSPDEFTIVIEDHGLSFEMKPPTDYDVQDVMNKRRSGGFGLHIIRRAMDSVEYHPDAVNGNRLVMVKKLH
jgi:anti-sigma regulatory factor (Ser/Thr protein kinase)